MRYWVYENSPTNRVTVHASECGFCNDGKGRKPDKIVKENIWHGPFEDELSATLFARRTGRPHAVHRCCTHPTPPTKSGSVQRFQLPVVDESTMSPADLFHHRMLEIYVRLRDEIGYSAIRFLRSVREHGGVEHAKRALRRPVAMQTGLQRLKDEGYAGLSMESYVIEPQFASLFTEWEICEARKRLGK